MSSPRPSAMEPLLEDDVLRSDHRISGLYVHRTARLYDMRLEVYHTKDRHEPELESVIRLKGLTASDVVAKEVDVKPKGATLLLSYVNGDVRQQTLVRTQKTC